MSTLSETWRTFHGGADNAGTAMGWPTETLIRLFRGPYLAGELPQSFKGMRVLDVGCGNGNNLVFLNSLGLELAGTEVHQDICTAAMAALARGGITADIRPGFNTELPFESNSFDFLVSWNVVHYETSEASMQAAIQEYARVLKPGGRMFVSTTGPDHKVMADAEALGGHLYRLGAAADFRQGSTQFLFDHPNYIKHYFSAAFDDVQVGRTYDDFFGRGILDWWLITAKARK